MEKLLKQSYKGIDYIELKDLTPVQAEALKSSLRRNEVINLQIEGEIKRNCVQYHHYEEWLNSSAEVFSGSPAKTQEQEIQPASIPKVALGT